MEDNGTWGDLYLTGKDGRSIERQVTKTAVILGLLVGVVVYSLGKSVSRETFNRVHVVSRQTDDG